MGVKKAGKLKIHYNRKEEKTAELVTTACEKALQLAGEDWGLKAPDNCHVYIMTSWQGFIFNSTPFKWKITLYLTLPLWVPRIRRTWPDSTAWTQRFGHRIAIGIKPPRLMATKDRKVSSILTVEEPDPEKEIQNITCHEIIHACSAHLILPMWLNEGIAIFSTEHFAEKPVVRQETLQLVKERAPKKEPPTYQNIAKMRRQAIAYHDSRGYWIVMYLEENHPGFLKDLLSMHRYEDEIEQKIAEVLGMEREYLWAQIDDIITGYYLEDVEDVPPAAEPD